MQTPVMSPCVWLSATFFLGLGHYACGPASYSPVRTQDAELGSDDQTDAGAGGDQSASNEAETETSEGSSDITEQTTEDSVHTDTPDGCEEIQCAPGGRGCGSGQKCTPWRCGDGCCTNSARCVALTGELGLDDDCVRNENEQTDDCGPGLFCMPDATSSGGGGPGRCLQLCVPESGTAGNCDKLGYPGQHCFDFNHGSLPVCLPTCDPIARDCLRDGEECYLAIDQFFCTQPTCADSCQQAQAGEECVTEQACQGGLVCAPSALSANCHNLDCGGIDICGCCARLCDLSRDDWDEVCDLEAGERCQPVIENPVDAIAHVGVCVVPPE